MTTKLDTTNHVVTLENESPQSSEDVACVRLDDVLGGAPPFVIKLDVEGYELEVLRGAERTLRDPGLQAVVMEINDSGRRYGRADNQLEALVLNAGFQRVAYAPFERRLVSATGHIPTSANNAIFVRDRRLVQRRLLEAPAFRVLGRII